MNYPMGADSHLRHIEQEEEEQKQNRRRVLGRADELEQAMREDVSELNRVLGTSITGEDWNKLFAIVDLDALNDLAVATAEKEIL
jgi:hypothetical protein